MIITIGDLESATSTEKWLMTMARYNLEERKLDTALNQKVALHLIIL